METDTCWPPGLLKIFDTISENSNTEDVFGAYNKMLNYCFDKDFDYVVCLQQSEGFMNFIIKDQNKKPMMLLQIRKSWDNTRILVDKQIRNACNFLLDQYSLTKIYGMSIVGTKMQIYEAGKLETIPPEDSTPYFWTVDILSQKGFDTMRGAIFSIKSLNDI